MRSRRRQGTPGRAVSSSIAHAYGILLCVTLMLACREQCRHNAEAPAGLDLWA